MFLKQTKRFNDGKEHHYWSLVENRRVDGGRKDDSGKWLWPGYGDNSRVLKWICERVEGTGKAQPTPIGNLPTADALDMSGLNLPAKDIQALNSVDAAGWKHEVTDIAANYAKFDSHLPKALHEQLDGLRRRLG